MTWADWLILTCGVAGVVLAQIPKTQRYACFAGGLGQVGWFSIVDYSSQPGIYLTCVVYALAWAYGLWLHWLSPWIETAFTMPTANPMTGRWPPKPRARTTKLRLRVVPKRP